MFKIKETRKTAERRVDSINCGVVFDGAIEPFTGPWLKVREGVVCLASHNNGPFYLVSGDRIVTSFEVRNAELVLL